MAAGVAALVAAGLENMAVSFELGACFAAFDFALEAPE
jgi:hypothetical protein